MTAHNSRNTSNSRNDSKNAFNSRKASRVTAGLPATACSKGTAEMLKTPLVTPGTSAIAIPLFFSAATPSADHSLICGQTNQVEK